MHQPVETDDVLAWYRMIHDYYTLDNPAPSLPYAETDIDMIIDAGSAVCSYEARKHDRIF